VVCECIPEARNDSSVDRTRIDSCLLGLHTGARSHVVRERSSALSSTSRKFETTTLNDTVTRIDRIGGGRIVDDSCSSGALGRADSRSWTDTKWIVGIHVPDAIRAPGVDAQRCVRCTFGARSITRSVFLPVAKNSGRDAGRSDRVRVAGTIANGVRNCRPERTANATYALRWLLGR